MPGIPLTRILQYLAGAALAAPAFFSTSLAAAADAPNYSGVFEKAFQPNFSVESQAPQSGGSKKAETVPFKTFDIGRLIIKSGQICAADPFVGIGATKPFTQAVPNGTFPVRLAVGFHPAGTVKDNRVAFARVDFSSAPVVRWSQALIEGQDPATLKPGEMFGYPVDAGTGSFYDPAANAAALALLARDPNATEAWQKDGQANGPKVIGPYSFVLMQPLGDVNVAMFHSGWGDGFYASYFGYDAQGNVAALVTDLATIDWATATW